MDRVKILVCCHKQDIIVRQAPYFPIHAGKALHPELDLGIPGDDTGDNISRKNANYCELTAMYWAWKNLTDTDVIGLCHYRRYFDFHSQGRPIVPLTRIPTKDYAKVDLSVPQSVVDSVRRGAVVVAKPRRFICSNIIWYNNRHLSGDLGALRTVLKEHYPQLWHAFNHVMYQQSSFYPYNMFIMRWADYDEYCTFLFDVLDKVEQRTDTSHYDDFQARLYGYLAERLLPIWLYARRSKTKELPVLFISDALLEDYERSTLGYLQRSLRGWLATQISCPRSFPG